MIDRRALLAALPMLAAPGFARADAEWPTRLVGAAKAQVGRTVLYDPAYVRLAYPGGDVPGDRGVCTDVIIRAYRAALGIDLQRLVHEDMKRAFAAYPKTWGLRGPDRNIDHRRVPNLETLFKRKGGAKTISTAAADYQPGDIVSWRLSGSGLPHIGVVTRKRQGGQPLIAHNIGAGTREEPCLFDWPMKGWFRFERWT